MGALLRCWANVAHGGGYLFSFLTAALADVAMLLSQPGRPDALPPSPAGEAAPAAEEKEDMDMAGASGAGSKRATLVSDSAVWITANFKETQLALLKVGQVVDVEVDSYPGCTASGKIESLSAATGAKFALLPPDNSTGNFTKVVQRVPVRIAITAGCGADRPLRPGMSVTASVVTK